MANPAPIYTVHSDARPALRADYATQAEAETVASHVATITGQPARVEVTR